MLLYSFLRSFLQSSQRNKLNSYSQNFNYTNLHLYNYMHSNPHSLANVLQGEGRNGGYGFLKNGAKYCNASTHFKKLHSLTIYAYLRVSVAGLAAMDLETGTWRPYRRSPLSGHFSTTGPFWGVSVGKRATFLTLLGQRLGASFVCFGRPHRVYFPNGT